jgi:predicted carbohydrate-binding protein with CBM5 and CBM33 domain
MHRTPQLRALAIAGALGAAALVLPVTTASTASAHGWVTSPPSRQDHCAAGRTSFDCGSIAYEPQSVEAPKGSTLCSGGSGFTILDDASKPWPVTEVDSTLTVRWRLTAAHNTGTWEYFVDGRLHQSFDQGGAQPPSDVSHTLTGLPSGRHTILARWNISNTINAFYNCVDVDVRGASTPTDPTPPTPPTLPASTDCVQAWSRSATYVGGQTASYGGRNYQAKWWTLGEVPGASDVWADRGACRSTTAAPTASTRSATDAGVLALR